MAKIVQLDNNMAWGRSVNAPPEILVDPNPIADVSGDLDAAFAIAQKEAAIAAMRMEEDHEKIAESAAALATLPKTIKLVPFPGFVIKTRRVVMDDNKVFINVFHHTSLPDETLILTYTPYSPKETNTGSTSPVSVAPDGTVTLPSVGERMTPIIYIGAKSSTEDKDGYASLLYNVLVSSSYFERRTVRNQELHITHPTSVNKVIFILLLIGRFLHKTLIFFLQFAIYVTNLLLNVLLFPLHASLSSDNTSSEPALQ